MNKKQERKTYLIDKSFQLSVAFRVVVYCMAAFLFVLLALTFWTTFVTSGGSFAENLLHNCRRHAPVLVGMFLFLPFAIFDSIKLSHRVTGPIHRLRTDLEKYRSDKSVRVRFRGDDYLQDLPESVNELLDQLQKLENEANNPNGSLQESLS